MKLIREEISDCEYIVEDKGDGAKKHFIRGIFMQANIKNRNGRVYPQDVLEKEVNRYRKEFIERKRAFGELGHPDGPTVNLERVSHLITRLEPDNKGNYIGEAKITRGMGTLENKGGTNYVKSDFYLATAADIVADPSAPQAFVNGVMEGKEWIWDNGLLKEKEVSEIQEQIDRETRQRNAKVEANAFENFMQKLTKR